MSCPIDATIHQGAVAPYAITYTATSTEFDLSTATGVVYRVFRAGANNDTYDSWTASITAQSTTSLSASYTLQAGDLPNDETITVVPHIATPSGDIVAAAKRIRVRAAKDLGC
jgi:hypothetical protein